MKFYVVAPAAYATGGPEALHQLASKAKSLGFDASICYQPEGHPNPRAHEYLHYDVDVAPAVVDSHDSFVVVPEVDAHQLFGLCDARRGLWWLSVDNFVARRERLRLGDKTGQSPLDLVYDGRLGVVHLTQSHYAMDHLSSRDVPSAPLTDYLHGSLVKELVSRSSQQKRDIVVYNPAKGIEITRQLMALDPSITWVPLEGLDANGVVDLLSQAKVYVDFGAHPGRDRIPREAVLAGSCVLVGARGSAAHPEDVPVPEDFRFAVSPLATDRVLSKIREVFDDYEVHAAGFSGYRSWVLAQERAFTDEVFSLFSSLEAQHRDQGRGPRCPTLPRQRESGLEIRLNTAAARPHAWLSIGTGSSASDVVVDSYGDLLTRLRSGGRAGEGQLGPSMSKLVRVHQPDLSGGEVRALLSTALNLLCDGGRAVVQWPIDRPTDPIEDLLGTAASSKHAGGSFTDPRADAVLASGAPCTPSEATHLRVVLTKRSEEITT